MSSSGVEGNEVQDSLLLGQVLDNRYDVQELVGRGGMGTVYRVRDWDWNVDLAVKVPEARQERKGYSRLQFSNCASWRFPGT